MKKQQTKAYEQLVAEHQRRGAASTLLDEVPYHTSCPFLCWVTADMQSPDQ